QQVTEIIAVRQRLERYKLFPRLLEQAVDPQSLIQLPQRTFHLGNDFGVAFRLQEIPHASGLDRAVDRIEVVVSGQEDDAAARPVPADDLEQLQSVQLR